MPKRVFVDLFNEAGVQVKPTFEIPHKDGGLFFESSEVMPTILTDKVRVARYKVVEPDGTTLSTIHTNGIDRFELDLAADRVLDNLDQPISLVENNPDGIIGIIEDDDELIGFIEDQIELIGVIDE